MQATPQQVSGGSLYSHKTRLGNWQEEIAISEAKLNNFRQRSETGALTLRKLEIKMQRCNEMVPLSFCEDGMIKFGDSIILQHDTSGAILACDPFEDLVQGQERFMVTGAEQPPVGKARNTFIVMRVPKKLNGASPYDDNDPYLRFGQSFCLGCSESLLVTQSNLLNPQLYLCSTKKNERNVTRNTNRQMVYLSPRNDADSVWLCMKPSQGRKNASERFLSNGTPVTTSEPMQLTHRQTNMYVDCDIKNKLESEFGVELECFCDRTAMSGKLGLMVSEFKGESTALTLAKPDNLTYSWHFVTAATAEDAVDRRGPLPPAPTYDAVLNEVHEDIKSKGLDGYWSLRAYFLALEQKAMNIGKVEREDLKDAMATWGCQVESKYLDQLLDSVDVGKMGLVAWRDWLQLLRGPSTKCMSADRMAVLKEVFSAMDPKQTGVVSTDDLAYFFNGTDHPLCTIGELNEKDALAHMFLSVSVRGQIPNHVSLATFVDYYADLSVCVDDSEYFENVVKAIWPSK